MSSYIIIIIIYGGYHQQCAMLSWQLWITLLKSRDILASSLIYSSFSSIYAHVYAHVHQYCVTGVLLALTKANSE